MFAASSGKHLILDWANRQEKVKVDVSVYQDHRSQQKVTLLESTAVRRNRQEQYACTIISDVQYLSIVPTGFGVRGREVG